MNHPNVPSSVNQLLVHVVKITKPSKVVLFGSRARGTHRRNSDIDLAVFGRQGTDHDWSKILNEISESNLTLYPVDLVEFENLSHEFQSNILKEGVVLYEQNH